MGQNARFDTLPPTESNERTNNTKESRQGAGERRAGGGAKPSAEPVGKRKSPELITRGFLILSAVYRTAIAYSTAAL